MIDEQYIDLVTSYLDGTQTAEQHRELNRLIEEGAIDIIDLKEMEQVYRQLGTLPAAEPSEALRNRFYQRLDREKAKNDGTSASVHRLFGGMPGRLNWRMVASAAAIFLVGLLAGDFMPLLNSHDQQIDRLTSEVSRMREVMMISLLNDSSPTERLKAVNMGSEIRKADNRVVEALLATLNNDSNVNVRLAAVEALLDHASNPAVRSGLVNAIANQESPSIQVALADAMLIIQEKQSIDEFQKLLDRNGLDRNVRDKLENTIAVLKS